MKKLLSVLALLSFAALPASAQLRPADVAAQLEKSDRVELSAAQLVIERYGFETDAGTVEAIVTRPMAQGKHPAIVLIPGHSRTAADMLPVAVRFARAGFATVSVSQPGYGRSTGPADFVGPRTFAALLAAAQRFLNEPFVDSGRAGVYGYSRGAVAAAQLAARTDLFKAAVLGGGIYDFRTAIDQVGLPGIRANMEAEAGRGEEAMRFRSPIHDMAGLDGPVLIVHGAADANAPPAQAIALAERLKTLRREHELVLVPDGTHALGLAQIVGPATAFFRRHLMADR